MVNRLLFVDAYDSFAQNIVAFLHQSIPTDIKIIPIKIDQIKITDKGSTGQSAIENFLSSFNAIVLGPGPGNPQNDDDVGIFTYVWQFASIHRIPTLGICLGFQSLCLRYGIAVTRMIEPCHGHAKTIQHHHRDIFKNLGDFEATNYNSLGVPVHHFQNSNLNSRPASSASNQSFSSYLSDPSAISNSVTQAVTRDLEILAWDHEDYVMAVRHTELPFWGVQFHPESCKSSHVCKQLIKNWWMHAVEHNKNDRPVRCDGRDLENTTFASEGILKSSQIPGASQQRCETLFYDISPATRMRALRGSSDHVVQTLALPVTLDDVRIRTLCKQLSLPGRVAMLNSTRKGRFSIHAVTDDTSFILEHSDRQLRILTDTRAYKYEDISSAATLQEVSMFVGSQTSSGGMPDLPFWGGFIGYLSYETGLDMIDVPSGDIGARLVPDVSLVWVERSVIYDHTTSIAYLQSIRQNDDEWLQGTAELLSKPSKSSDMAYSSESDRVTLNQILASATISRPEHDLYTEKIGQCQEQLRAGNSYELCLTTEARVETTAGCDNAFILYNNLHRHNPVPFGAFLHLNDVTILSTSPEQYLSWSRSGTIDMIPMKGTVKRSPEMTLDRATEILSSAKESAENLMIADLIRHDLYTTVGPRSLVEVVKLCSVIEHETVYQLVSHIRAHMPIPVDADDSSIRDGVFKYGYKSLQCTLPPGSMTGAPKKRSCEILAGLEGRHRGVYSGVIGFLDVGGSGSWSVAIRTAFSSEKEDCSGRQTWHVGAGGAITVLSDIESEWEEMRVKLDSVLKGFEEA